jgi:hypothetical protein
MKKLLLGLTLLTSFSAMAYTTSYTKHFYVSGDSCAEIKELMDKHMPRVKAYYKSRNKVITNMNISTCEDKESNSQQQSSVQLKPGININTNQVDILNKDMSFKISVEGQLLVRDI